jgi:hypothetical protein
MDLVQVNKIFLMKMGERGNKKIPPLYFHVFNPRRSYTACNAIILSFCIIYITLSLFCIFRILLFCLASPFHV